jgi:hypothetical protein
MGTNEHLPRKPKGPRMSMPVFGTGEGKTYKRRWLFKFAGLMVALAVIMISYPLSTLGGDVFGIPTSNKVIEGQLSFPASPGTQPIRFTIRDGTMLTLIDERAGLKRTDLWQPSIDGSNLITFNQMRIIDGGKLANEAPSVRVPIGKGFDLSANDPIRLETFRVVTRSPPDIAAVNPQGASPQKIATVDGKTGGGLCCITCDGRTICASAVSTSCGSCE